MFPLWENANTHRQMTAKWEVEEKVPYEEEGRLSSF